MEYQNYIESVEKGSAFDSSQGYDRPHEFPIGGEYSGPTITAEGPILGKEFRDKSRTEPINLENMRLSDTDLAEAIKRMSTRFIA